jgi:hypothetical protein
MIGIVYHNYLVGNWREIVIQQLERLKTSGLYDSADEIHFTVNLAEETEEAFNETIKDYNKAQIEFHINNSFEYPGIKKVKELGDKHDNMKIFYFHTKGVSNNYKNHVTREISSEKIENIKLWKECLEYFLIDKWEESIKKLDEYDTVGVTCNGGWYWGNFWWTTSEYIKGCEEVGMWGRWDYEAWLNKGRINPRNYEFWHFFINPYVTKLDKDLYTINKSQFKGCKINLIKAEYGTPPYQIDEGYDPKMPYKTSDVTKYVEEMLKSTNYEYFNIRVDNSVLGGDPAYLYRKFLFLTFVLDCYPDKVYKFGISEGHTLDYKFYE